MAKTSWALIGGAGPGLGTALIEAFSADGMTAIGLRRSGAPADSTHNIRACDLTDADQLRATLDPLIAEFGPPRVVVHNPSQMVRGDFDTLTPADFDRCWQGIVLSAVHLAHICLPVMASGKGGTFIATGATASQRGGAQFAAFASAKFGLRGLCQSLARAYHPKGVHVVHTIIDGIIASDRARAAYGMDPDQMMEPADIARQYVQLAAQPPSVWSHEADFRPAPERF